MKLFFFLIVLFLYVNAADLDIDSLEIKCFKTNSNLLSLQNDNSLNIFEQGLKYYLLAVYTADKKSLEKAEYILEQIDKNEAKALLGSIQTLKARDFAGNSTARTLLSLTPIGFVRIYHVNNGIDLLDEAIEKDPNNELIRLIRAMTYYSLPYPFMQYLKGVEDSYWLKENISMFPLIDKLGIDENIAYWVLAKYSNHKKDIKNRDIYLSKIIQNDNNSFSECAKDFFKERK